MPERSDSEQVRLQRVLAAAGVASRRASEDLIAAGRVSVDGEVVTTPGSRVDPTRAVIRVDGERISADATRAYLAVNKPAGMLTTMRDSAGRPSVSDLVGNRHDRLFHVGRLDADTEGLLLLTNDGTLAHRLTHPSLEVPKLYVAEVTGALPTGLGRALRAGVDLADGPARATRFRVLERVGKRSLVEVEVTEGRNRLVRRLLAAVDLTVDRLVRIRVGPIRLGQLPVGKTRVLTADEVQALFKVAQM